MAGAALAVLLIAAAVEDGIRLRISNITVGLVLVGAIVAAVAVGPAIPLWQNLVGLPCIAGGRNADVRCWETRRR